MKILFLNTWNGRRQGFVHYISTQVPSIDVFCFQEAYQEMKDLCSQILSGYTLYTTNKKIEGDDFPMATYVREGLRVVSSRSVLDEIDSVGVGLYTELESNGNRLNLINFHGRAYPGDKLDTPSRITQSESLLVFLDKLRENRVLGGDFNLDINSRSIKMLEAAGYRNLIKEYGIKTTRNKIIWEKYPKTPQYYSDYVFVDPEIRIEEFTVPKDIVSDHQPMKLGLER